MTVSGYIAITRPVNSVVSGLAALVGYLVATGTIIPQTLILVPIVTFVTAAGNVINDYFDAGIDAVNRPERPIPSGGVRPDSAPAYAASLFLAGLILALFTPPICIAIVVINSVLLVLYAARLKSMPLIGNAAVSYLSASIFLFGGAFAGVEGLVADLPLAGITFLAMLTRELLKDAEDVEGDIAGGATTLPMIIGIRRTGWVALFSVICAAAASLWPYSRWGIPYLVAIAVVDCALIAASARALSCTDPGCVKASKATTLLKGGFFASLLVFTLSAFFL